MPKGEVVDGLFVVAVIRDVVVVVVVVEERAAVVGVGIAT